MIPTSDIHLHNLIQHIQTNRIAARGGYKGTIRQSGASKVPSVFFTFIQKVKALSPEFLFQVKEYECITAWAIAADIARIEAGLALCQNSSSLSLHGRRAALKLYYKDDPKAKFPISNKPCNSQFCPFCAVRRIEELEDQKIPDAVFADYRCYMFCYGSFLASSYTETDVDYSIASLSRRSKEHELICGMRKFEYLPSTNRIVKLDYVLGINKANSIAGYTPLTADPTHKELQGDRYKINAYTMLMPNPATILQLMRLDANIMHLLRFNQRSTFRIYETHRATAGEASDGVSR